MRWLFSTIILSLALCNTALAQNTVSATCAHTKMQAYRHLAKGTVASPEEDRYDVVDVTMNLELDNNSVFIKGDVTTTATILEDNFGLYVFELNQLLNIDSVLINGIRVPYSRDDDIVKVLTPTILHKDSVLIARIFYQGMPQTGTVFFFQSGLNNAPAVDWGSPVTYTLSEPYNSKDWWPCKQSLQDKIETATISITVPDSLMAGSNGVLQQKVAVPPNKTRYTWHTDYPTAYYLLSVAVADYTDYSYTQTLPDGNNVLVQNYIYDRDSILDVHKAGIDTTGMMLHYFSELFGTYPFYQEKYGHCMAPVFGGMEHQTMTTLHNFKAPLVAHELAHQWFGDNVTCATWRDIWLNEGFASYAEYLYAEKFWRAETAKNYMQEVHDYVLEDIHATGAIYLQEGDTVNPYRIFDTRLSYDKASAVLHSLRYVINNDETFFSILKEYQKRYAFGNATTLQFYQMAEEMSGLDLSNFFDEWIYGAGYPVYHIRWNQMGNQLFVQLKQRATTPESVPYFTTPLELLITTTSGDTTIKVTPKQTDELYTIAVKETANNIIVDPNNYILNKSSVHQDLSIGVNLQSKEVFVYPNPTNDNWKIINIKAGSELSLTNSNGKVVWTSTTDAYYGVQIPSAQFSRGVYLLRVRYGNDEVVTKKLIKL